MRGSLLRHPLRFASVMAALSCQAVLGIEDLSEQPRPGAVGAGGESGAGSGPDGSAGSSAGGDGGEQGLAGASAAGAGVEPVSNGGDPTDAGLPGPGGDTADAAPPGPGTITVAGHVVDFFRRPVPNVPVSIGGLPSTATDAGGNFSIAGVTPPYDVSLVLNFMRNGTVARYGYVYEGLTRTDPTLQVYSALLERATGSFDVNIDNGEFDLNENRRVILAFGSSDGRFVDEGITSFGTSFAGGIEWTGPATISGNVHALRLLGTDDFESSPPAAYEAHQATALNLQDNVAATVSFDMQATDVPTDLIGGSIGGGPVGERSNYVALRFTDGTTLPLLDEFSADEEFAYVVPVLADSSLVVGAADGFSSDPPYAVAWRDAIPAGELELAFDIPNPVVPSAPAPGATVDASTTFSWSTAGQTARSFVWHLESADAGVPFLEGIFVVTSRTSIQLPQFSGGFELSPGSLCVWSVETHGEAANVDALAGPDGFLDPFSVLEDYPVGPRRGSGYYTESLRTFVTLAAD